MIHLSDNWVRLTELTNNGPSPAELVSDATVQLLDMVDRNGTRPTGLTVPQTMAAIAGTPGGYEYLINRDNVTLTLGMTYRVTVDADAGVGLRRRFQAIVKCKSPLE